MTTGASFASGLSRHPDAAAATGEVIGAIDEGLGGDASVAVLFVAGRHIDSLDEIVESIDRLLSPTVLVGGTAVGVVGDSEEIEDGDGVSLWAASGIDVLPLRLESLAGNPPLVAGLPDRMAAGSTIVAIADPYTFDVGGLVGMVDEHLPSVAVVGGLASAPGGPERNRLIGGGSIVDDGAVAFIVPPGVAAPIVSQGCRPIGSPWVVTEADGQLVRQLGGQPAMTRLASVIEALSPAERAIAARGLHVGLVANEQQASFGQGDFLIRGLLGAERASGSIAVGDDVDVGQVLQFQVRDAASASSELERLLEPAAGSSALLFTCNGRGTHLFDEPSHDASRVHAAIGGPVAGMFCAGELGPIGGRNAVHGFTATVIVFA